MTIQGEEFQEEFSHTDAALLGRLVVANANGELVDPLDPTSAETVEQWRRVATPLAIAAGIEVHAPEGKATEPAPDDTPVVEQRKVRGLSREFSVDDGSTAKTKPGTSSTNGSLPSVDRRQPASASAEAQPLNERLHGLHQQLKERLLQSPTPVKDDHLLAHERRAWFMKAITQGNEHQEMMRRVFSQLFMPQQREVLSQMIDQYGHYRESQPRCQAISPETRVQLDELLGLNDCDGAHEVADIASEHGLKETSVKTNLRTNYGLKISEGFDLDEAFVPLVSTVAGLQHEVDSKKKRSRE